MDIKNSLAFGTVVEKIRWRVNGIASRSSLDKEENNVGVNQSHFRLLLCIAELRRYIGIKTKSFCYVITGLASAYCFAYAVFIIQFKLQRKTFFGKLKSSNHYRRAEQLSQIK